MQSKYQKIPLRAAVLTLGCKVNQYESEAIAEGLKRNGFIVSSPDDICDLYIINSCTVTAESDRKSRQTIRHVLSKNPSAYVIVTGCSAQRDADRISKITGVDHIIGNREKMKVVAAALDLVNSGSKPISPIIDVPTLECADFEKMNISHFDRTRAYIKIEDGCEAHCAYCTIPAARGPIRSKPACDVIQEVEELCRKGCREIVLTGIETGSYGRDIGRMTLADLMERIDAIPSVHRIRTGSLDPSVITQEFADRVSRLKSAAPHYHLSLQSGCSTTLARMRRRYNADMAMRSLERLRERTPQVMFTTDVIVGFPGESEEEFEQTLDFVKRAKFLKIHIFPYSVRIGTEAAGMKDQVSDTVKRERVKRLSALESHIRTELLEKWLTQNQQEEVLFETWDGEYAYGHTPSFVEIKLKSNRDLKGELHNVSLLEREGDCIVAKLV